MFQVTNIFYNYELTVLQNGKAYDVDADGFIGVQKGEPFEVMFKNGSNKIVQIKLGIDGTDVISGEEISTSPNGQMWVVKPYDSMVLKAWPETNNGGSRFVFTDLKKSVAKNTHGNVNNIGLISAYVYVENPRYDVIPTWVFNSFPYFSNIPGVYSKTYTHSYTKAADSVLRGGFIPTIPSTNYNTDSIAAGAGEYTQQQLSAAVGLKDPVLNRVIKIRYAQAKPIKSSKRINLKNIPHEKTAQS